MITVKYLDKKVIAFTYRAKRYAGTDEGSEVVLEKSGSASHLGLPLLLHEPLEWLRLSLVWFSPTVLPKLSPGVVWMATWAGSHLSNVGAEGSLGTDHAAFVMAVENLTLRTNTCGAWVSNLPITVVFIPIKILGEWSSQILIFLENQNFSKFDKILEKSIFVSWRTLWCFFVRAAAVNWHTDTYIYTYVVSDTFLGLKFGETE